MMLHSGNEAAATELPTVEAPVVVGALASFFADWTKSGVSAHFRLAVRRAMVSQLFYSTFVAFVAGCFARAATEKWLFIAGVSAAAFGSMFAFLFLFRPRPTTTFVGANGLARVHHLAGGALKVDELSFDAVDHLAVQRIVRGKGRPRVLFAYRFRDARDQTLFEIVGGYSLSSRGAPETGPENPIHFAHAAEAAWVARRAPELLAAIDRGETVTFRAARKEWIKLQGREVEISPPEGAILKGLAVDLDGPTVGGALLYFSLASAPTKPDLKNPFQPPRQSKTCKFDGSEMRDVALLSSLLGALRERQPQQTL
ncbi:MAG: hypothetical protein U0271_12315 [Polyangiaceae bacterium]